MVLFAYGLWVITSPLYPFSSLFHFLRSLYFIGWRGEYNREGLAPLSAGYSPEINARL
jgi:hypothetical protein